MKPNFAPQQQDMKINELEISRHYLRMQVETAPRSKQLVMLHERCVLLAKESMALSGPQRRSTLNTAQNIIALLQRSLRINDEVSQSLFYVYDYAYSLLETGGNEECRNMIRVFGVISDAFRGVFEGKSG